MVKLRHQIDCSGWFILAGCVWCMGLALPRPTNAQATIPSEMSPSEVSPSEMPPSEMSPSEVSPSEVSPSEVSPSEVSPSEAAVSAPANELVPMATGSVVVPCHRCGHTPSLCGCGPESPPVHEVEPGPNLFWYGRWIDPCAGDPCQGPHCIGFPTCARPNWYVMADLVPLLRDQGTDVPFQTLGRGGEVVLDTDDCSNDFDAGARVGLGYTLGPWYRLEAAYMGSYEWNERAAVWDFGLNGRLEQGRLFSPFSHFGEPHPTVGLDFNQFASIEMHSTLNSVEFNLRRRWNLPAQRYHYAATSFLVGIRYLNIEEQLLYRTESAVPSAVGAINEVDIRTENDLVGVQLGWLSQFLVHSRGWLDFEIKGGIYDNRGTLNTLFLPADLDGTSLGEFGYSDDRDRTAFMGELSLSYSHQITSAVTFRVGYNAIWLTGVGLASENMPTDINLLALGPAQLKQCGDIVYHGPNLGLVFAY